MGVIGGMKLQDMTKDGEICMCLLLLLLWPLSQDVVGACPCLHEDLYATSGGPQPNFVHRALVWAALRNRATASTENLHTMTPKLAAQKMKLAAMFAHTPAAQKTKPLYFLHPPAVETNSAAADVVSYLVASYRARCWRQTLHRITHCRRGAGTCGRYPEELLW